MAGLLALGVLPAAAMKQAYDTHPGVQESRRASPATAPDTPSGAFSHLVVSKLGDSPGGFFELTLRDAMNWAAGNVFGYDLITIEFNLPVQCPATIFLDSPLPDITGGDVQVYINGYSQPGSSVNTLSDGSNATICVRIQPSAQAGTLSHAFRVPAVNPAQLRLAGVGLGGFSTAVTLFGGNGHLIRGNRIGGSGLSSNLPGNAIGIWLTGGAVDVEIGDLAPGGRNTFAGNGFAALLVDGSPNIGIYNNYIGTNPDGGVAVGNGFGVIVSDAASALIYRNLVSGNLNDGVLLAGPATFNTVVTGNRIGLKRHQYAAGNSALGNGGSGVRVDEGHDNVIGPTGFSTGNSIAHNGDGGVWVMSGRRNRISRNAIFANVGLGIDLAAPGLNPNDDDSAILPADYANRGLNFPVLVSAGGATYGGTVSGSLTSTPGSYRIEFYANGGRGCDPSGHGEGLAYVGGVDVTIPSQNPGPPQGTAAFSTTVISSGGLPGRIITATATDEDGNTSEFSACETYVGDDLIFADGFEDD